MTVKAMGAAAALGSTSHVCDYRPGIERSSPLAPTPPPPFSHPCCTQPSYPHVPSPSLGCMLLGQVSRSYPLGASCGRACCSVVHGACKCQGPPAGSCRALESVTHTRTSGRASEEASGQAEEGPSSPASDHLTQQPTTCSPPLDEAGIITLITGIWRHKRPLDVKDPASQLS